LHLTDDGVKEAIMVAEEKPPRENRTKQMMIRAAADLMQRRGYAGTGVAEILSQASAPRGSLYHHFPGGKREIAIEAVRYSGRLFERDLQRIAAESGSIHDYFVALSALSKRDLLATNFDASCPIAATALDVPHDEHDILQACALAFDSWSHAITKGLEKIGVAKDKADSFGPFFLNTLLGAVMAARAARDAHVVDSTLMQLQKLVDK
jgi:TetR/AcrR family transcriptional regulator, lmrAB and yxaGH operons repressor